MNPSFGSLKRKIAATNILNIGWEGDSQIEPYDNTGLSPPGLNSGGSCFPIGPTNHLKTAMAGFLPGVTINMFNRGCCGDRADWAQNQSTPQRATWLNATALDVCLWQYLYNDAAAVTIGALQTTLDNWITGKFAQGTLPIVCGATAALMPSVDTGPASYRAAIRDIADSRGVVYVDQTDQVRWLYNRWQNDNQHPVPAAHQEMGFHIGALFGDHPGKATPVASPGSIWYPEDHLISGASVTPFSSAATGYLTTILPWNRVWIGVLCKDPVQVVVTTYNGTAGVYRSLGISYGTGNLQADVTLPNDGVGNVRSWRLALNLARGYRVFSLYAMDQAAYVESIKFVAATP